MKQVDRVTIEWVISEKPEAIGSEWEFYGGGFYSGKNIPKIEVSEVDWDKTKPLQSAHKGSFTDTFHDPDIIDTLEGDLYLLSGKSFRIGLAIDSQEMLNSIVEYMIDKEK